MANSTSLSLSPQTSSLLGGVAKALGLNKAGAVEAMALDYARRLGVEDDLCSFDYMSGGKLMCRKEDRYIVARILKDSSSLSGYAFDMQMLDADDARELAAFIHKAIHAKSVGVEITTCDGWVRACRRGPSVSLDIFGSFKTTTVSIANRIAEKLMSAADKLDAMPSHELTPTSVASA